MHPARLALLDVLRRREACVCHLETALGYRQAYISQQLMVLREAGLIEDRRDGWNVFYHVTDPGIFTVLTAVEQFVGVENDPTKTNGAVSCPCPQCSSGGSA